MPTEIFKDADNNQWYESDTLFCSGHSFMANGDLFIAGGTELYSITSPDETVKINLLYAAGTPRSRGWPIRACSSPRGSTSSR